MRRRNEEKVQLQTVTLRYGPAFIKLTCLVISLLLKCNLCQAADPEKYCPLPLVWLQFHADCG